VRTSLHDSKFKKELGRERERVRERERDGKRKFMSKFCFGEWRKKKKEKKNREITKPRSKHKFSPILACMKKSGIKGWCEVHKSSYHYWRKVDCVFSHSLTLASSQDYNFQQFYTISWYTLTHNRSKRCISYFFPLFLFLAFFSLSLFWPLIAVVTD
jgi:hypothetical protein